MAFDVNSFKITSLYSFLGCDMSSMVKVPTSRQKQKANTRSKLKKVAKASFLKQGIDATNTRSISASAEVAVGTFFAHFPDKMSLIKEIFFDEMDASLHLSANELVLLPKPHPCDFLYHYAHNLFDFYLEYREFTLLVLGQSLLQKGFFQAQLLVLTQGVMQRFDDVGVDESSSRIFAENMTANFQQVLLDMLASQGDSKVAWLTRLLQLNRPFEHMYQTAEERFQG